MVEKLSEAVSVNVLRELGRSSQACGLSAKLALFGSSHVELSAALLSASCASQAKPFKHLVVKGPGRPCTSLLVAGHWPLLFEQRR